MAKTVKTTEDVHDSIRIESYKRALEMVREKPEPGKYYSPDYFTAVDDISKRIERLIGNLEA